jgi:hypothetical protein
MGSFTMGKEMLGKTRLPAKPINRKHSAMVWKQLLGIRVIDDHRANGLMIAATIL